MFYIQTLYSYDLSNLDTKTYGEHTITHQYAASTVATSLSIEIDRWTNTIIGPSYDVPFPSCSVPYTQPTCSFNHTPCTLDAPNVQLIYFPVSTVSGNPNLTITPTGTSMPTAVYDGKTYTSGNVYFKYDYISAFDGCFRPVGNSYPGAIVTLRSDAVSSLRNDGTIFVGPYSFNYADLNYPVPYDVWISPLGCNDEYPGCGPVESGPYRPYVSIPSEVKNLDPAWANCTIHPGVGSWDPPYALMPVQGILTQPGSTTLPTATPAHKATSQAYSTPVALSTQSAGAMRPSTFEAENPPSFPGTTATGVLAPIAPSGDPQVPSPLSSASRVLSPDLQVSTEEPDASAGGSLGDLSLHPPFSAKTIFTVSNSVINLGPTAIAIKLPGQTTSPQLLSMDPAALSLIVASELLTLGGQTFASGTTYSLLPIPTAVIIDGSTTNLPPPSDPITTPAIIKLGSALITQDIASDFIIGSQTLTPGGAIIVSGTTFYLPVSPTAVVIDGTAIHLSPASDPITIPPVITVDASIITEDAASDFVIGSQTLKPGGQITVSGKVISLDASATVIIFGSTSTQGLGALILSGFGQVGAPTATDTTTGIKFVTGEASTKGLGWWSDILKTKVMLHVTLIFVAIIGF